MQIQRYFATACIGALNGLGLGGLLEGLRQYQNLAFEYQLLLDRVNISSSDPWRWYAIPTFVLIGMAMLSLVLFTLFPSLSKHVLWSWLLVGFVGFSIALIAEILLSSHDLSFYVNTATTTLRVGGVVCLYQAWFGLILFVGTQRK
jgi:hypothetical protein